MTQPQAPQLNYERVAARFQQRLAETVAKYEADIIVLREQYEAEIERLKSELESKTEGEADVVSEEAPA